MKAAAVLLLLLYVSSVPGAAEEPHLVPLSATDLIHVGDGGGWGLDIKPDGSAEIHWGAGPHQIAAVPAGTFDFKEAYILLAGVVRPHGSVSESFAVAFRRRGATTKGSWYSDASGVVRSLFKKALECCQPPPGSTDEEMARVRRLGGPEIPTH